MARSDAEPSPTTQALSLEKGKGLIHHARTKLREHTPRDAVEARLMARADGIFDALDTVAEGLQRVTHLQERLLERLLPVVDDLGELVRHQLDDARARRGIPPRKPHGDRRPVVIDHDAADDASSSS